MKLLCVRNMEHEKVAVWHRLLHLDSAFRFRVMESVAVYLDVRFRTGRGEALRLFDCFIMVIYTAIYLCILCYVCHYFCTRECLFVCVRVRPSKEDSVFGPPCELDWVTARASRLLRCTTHSNSHTRTHTPTVLWQSRQRAHFSACFLLY